MQGVSLHGVRYDKFDDLPSHTEGSSCLFKQKRVYYSCGADEVRCVGDCSTCAGVREGQLLYTAAVLFSIHTIASFIFIVNIIFKK